jgi:outer membrane protein assembly factor BamE (lipoprotein component of BamABCDE complex)
MMNLKQYLTILLPLTLFFILSGCQTMDVRGQYVSDQDIEQIIAKKPSKETVIEMVGSPTYVPSFSTDNWYYIQRSLTSRAWSEPNVVEPRIIKITFNNNKVNDAIILMDMQNENIKISSDFTKTYGTEQTNIQKFVKNMGRFNSTTSAKKKRKKK